MVGSFFLVLHVWLCRCKCDFNLHECVSIWNHIFNPFTIAFWPYYIHRYACSTEEILMFLVTHSSYQIKIYKFNIVIMLFLDKKELNWHILEYWFDCCISCCPTIRILWRLFYYESNEVWRTRIIACNIR